MQKHVPVTVQATHCGTCTLGHVCLPVGMPTHEVEKLDNLVNDRIRIPKGEPLYHHGDSLDALYALRAGSMKTIVQDAHGQGQISGFFLPGEIIGLDGMGLGVHGSSAIAMEDSEVCVVKLETIDAISHQVPSLQSQVRRVLSQEIARSHQVLLALGSMRSEQRLAAFLLNISQRMAALGYSPTEFVMRMSREEIGNHLGLTLETISRLFSRFAKDGFIRVQQRSVQLLDIHALEQLVGKNC